MISSDKDANQRTDAVLLQMFKITPKPHADMKIGKRWRQAKNLTPVRQAERFLAV
jgi:hypothetical protein